MTEENLQTNQIQNNHTWLMFKSLDRFFAIESHMVKEIMRNNEIFPVPFVPDYVNGIINYYGNPYAVVDFSMFLDDGKTKSSLFMILNTDDNLALQITDINEFFSESGIIKQKISTGNDTSYFSEAIIASETMAPVLNIENIIKKIRSDIEH